MLKTQDRGEPSHQHLKAFKRVTLTLLQTVTFFYLSTKGLKPEYFKPKFSVHKISDEHGNKFNPLNHFPLDPQLRCTWANKIHKKQLSTNQIPTSLNSTDISAESWWWFFAYLKHEEHTALCLSKQPFVMWVMHMSKLRTHPKWQIAVFWQQSLEEN